MNWWFNDLFSLLKPMFSGCFFFLFSTYEWWDEPKQLANKHICILTWLIPFPILFVSFRSSLVVVAMHGFLLLFLKPFSNVICVHATSYWHKRFFSLCLSRLFMEICPIYANLYSYIDIRSTWNVQKKSQKFWQLFHIHSKFVCRTLTWWYTFIYWEMVCACARSIHVCFVAVI